MAHKLNTIVLKALGHHDEGVAGGTITPGQAVRLQAAGTYLQETLSQTIAAKSGLKIAKEAGLPGSVYITGTGQLGTVDSNYLVNNVLFFYTPLPGDEINILCDTGQNISVGDLLGVLGSGNGNFGETSTPAGAVPIPLSTLKAPTALQTPIGAASSTIMGLVTGTVGTNAPSAQSIDFKTTSPSTKAIAEFIIPQDYVAGAPLSLVIKTGMITTVADTSCTLTVEAFKDAGDGTVGANIGPAAQSINSLTAANKTFVITPTGLVPGDKLILRFTFTGVDAASGTAVIAAIYDIRALTSTSQGAQFEALESSGGALGAPTLLAARVLNV